MLAPRILRLEPCKGTGVTVEWMPVPSDAPVAHYQLEWKLLSDSKWGHTEASSKLQTTLVTKGSLRVNGAYQFRVRAFGKETNEWGAWCAPTPPLSPSAELSTIEEEGSTAWKTPTRTAASTSSPCASGVRRRSRDGGRAP